MNHALLPPALASETVVACLGLIADTHMPKRWPQLPAAVFDVFHGVDLVLHAGDLGRLWVLDQLSAAAPVVAVHGNDETDEAQRELPYQQLLTVNGRRLLLCHGHLPDRQAELASRAGDDWRPKLAQRAAQARRAGARIMVFGHLHIPFVTQFEGVWLVNPGAIASGSAFTRQTRQTVALLYLRDDGRPFVAHVDLARPGQSYEAQVDWTAGFEAASQRYYETFLDPRLRPAAAALRASRFRFERRLWLALSRIGMPYFTGEKTMMAAGEMLAGIEAAEEFSAAERAELLALIRDNLAE
jgi:putative phosphoesterase